MGGGNYFKEVLIEPNLSFKLVPRLFTTVMIASAMPAAMRPYSIAVAPDSSDQNFKTMCFKICLRSISGCVGSATHPEIYGMEPSAELILEPQLMRKLGTKVPKIELTEP